MDIHEVRLTHQTADALIAACRLMEEHPGVTPEEAEEARLAGDLILDTFDTQHRLNNEDEPTNAWPEHDTAPCVRDGEHHSTQRHPFAECPTAGGEED